MSLVKKFYFTYKSIKLYGVDRVKWILNYVEEILGGRKSFEKKLPVDSNDNPLPWYTYPAIEYLQQFDFSHCSVFEYGSGNSTKFWAGRALSITSVETNPEWHRINSKDMLSHQSLYLKTEEDGYVDAINLKENLYDVIIIDGEYRYKCSIEAARKVKKGGFIILDNSDWFPKTSKYLRDKGFTQVDFCGMGPVNTYAWCTSFYFNGSLRIPRKFEEKANKVLGGLVQISKDD